MKQTTITAKKSLLASLVLATALTACSDPVVDPNTQYGANPQLPDAKNFLVPPMKVPVRAGWQAGQAPKAANGL